MNKGAVPQRTENEKTISRSGWKGTFNPAIKDSNYLGKMTRIEGSQKAEKGQIVKISSLRGSWNGKSGRDFQLGCTKRKKL